MGIGKTIKNDLQDEKEAKVGYRKLAKALKKTGQKRAARSVKAIAKDEADHFRILTKIKKLVS
jgi:rubrerythrin